MLGCVVTTPFMYRGPVAHRVSEIPRPMYLRALELTRPAICAGAQQDEATSVVEAEQGAVLFRDRHACVVVHVHACQGDEVPGQGEEPVNEIRPQFKTPCRKQPIVLLDSQFLPVGSARAQGHFDDVSAA